MLGLIGQDRLVISRHSRHTCILVIGGCYFGHSFWSDTSGPSNLVTLKFKIRLLLVSFLEAKLEDMEVAAVAPEFFWLQVLFTQGIRWLLRTTSEAHFGFVELLGR